MAEEARASTLDQLFVQGWNDGAPGLHDEWRREIDKTIAVMKGDPTPYDIITELLDLIGDERLSEAARQQGFV